MKVLMTMRYLGCLRDQCERSRNDNGKTALELHSDGFALYCIRVEDSELLAFE